MRAIVAHLVARLIRVPSIAPRPWRDVPFEGSWYPHAFVGSMASLMRFVEGSTKELPTRVEDALRTMAVVEAAYTDSANGGTEVTKL